MVDRLEYAMKLQESSANETEIGYVGPSFSSLNTISHPRYFLEHEVSNFPSSPRSYKAQLCSSEITIRYAPLGEILRSSTRFFSAATRSHFCPSCMNLSATNTFPFVVPTASVQPHLALMFECIEVTCSPICSAPQNSFASQSTTATPHESPATASALRWVTAPFTIVSAFTIAMQLCLVPGALTIL